MKYALAAVLLLAPVVASAQAPLERLPLFVIDAHAATVGLPQAEGWVPEVPVTTELPGRSWGLGAGATVYPFRLGNMTIGFGASLLKGSSTAETEVVTGSGATAVTSVSAAVHTGITNLMPQVSINFGRKQGWSYLSAGIGRSRVTSRTDPSRITSPASTSATTVSPTPIVVPEAWNQALNFGGGARWFMKPRIGAGFDVRFVKLSSRSPTDILPSAKRTQVWNISAGISIQ